MKVALLPVTFLLSFLALLLPGVGPRAAHAQITVDRVIVLFKNSQRPIDNIVVKNTGDKALYVTVEPDVMVNPGDKDESRVHTTDLLVSPKRFSLDPNGERSVRLLLKKPHGDEEQVYRVK